MTTMQKVKQYFGVALLLTLITIASNSWAQTPLQPNQVSEFIERAEAGGDIRLAAGIFQINQPLILENGVSITGAGQGETVLEISAESNGAALRFTGDVLLSLRDLTVRYSGRKTSSVIIIRSGIANFSNVEVTGGHGETPESGPASGIRFFGNSQGIIDASTVRNNDGSGIVFYEETQGTVTGSLFDRNASGIRLFENSQAMIEDNILRNNEWSGIAFFGSSEGTARNNISEGHDAHGIAVSETSSALLQGNTLRRNGWGIIFMGDSSGVAEDNVSQDNERDGIIFWQNAGGEARNNVCEGNGRHGILIEIDNEGPVLTESNTLRNNEFYGIYVVGENADVTMRGNQFSGNGSGETFTRRD